jgi:hypothetical protein
LKMDARWTEPGREFWSAYPFRQRGKRELPPIREKIFSAEMKGLAAEILAHTGQPPEAKPAVSVFRLDPALFNLDSKADGAAIAAALLSKSKLTEADFGPALGFILEKSSAGAVALLLPDELEGVYRVSLHNGLDTLTERNLIIGFRDTFVAENMPVQSMTYNSEIRNSFHYRKRFSTAFVEKFPCALYLHFPTLDTSSFCALFFGDEADVVRAKTDETLAFLGAVYPAVFKFSFEKLNPETRHEDPTLKFMKLFKRHSHTGKDDFFVTHIHLSDKSALSTHHPFLGKFQEFCLSHAVADHTVILSPNHAVLLHSQENIDRGRYLISNLAQEWGITSDFVTVRYPSEESNLYNLMLA